jgi:hypothetical protein
MDSVTGRFLSADPYLSEPGNTQNFNRYGYVYNNPLSYVDPTGYLALSETNTVSQEPIEEIFVTATRQPATGVVNVVFPSPGGGIAGSRLGVDPPEDEAKLEEVFVTANRLHDAVVIPVAVIPPPKQSPKHVIECLAKGAVVGAVVAVGVGALAVGAVLVGAPVAAVTAVLGVVGSAGLAATGVTAGMQISNGNYAGAAFSVGSIAGGVAIGGAGGGRALAEGINGVPSPPWSLGSDAAQTGYNPGLGPVSGWLATGPNPGSATATATGLGAIVARFLSGCN